MPVCRELGVGIVPYSPIGRGMLTGKFANLDSLDASDFRRTVPRFGEAALDKVSISPVLPLRVCHLCKLRHWTHC